MHLTAKIIPKTIRTTNCQFLRGETHLQLRDIYKNMHIGWVNATVDWHEKEIPICHEVKSPTCWCSSWLKASIPGISNRNQSNIDHSLHFSQEVYLCICIISRCQLGKKKGYTGVKLCSKIHVYKRHIENFHTTYNLVTEQLHAHKARWKFPTTTLLTLPTEKET